MARTHTSQGAAFDYYDPLDPPAKGVKLFNPMPEFIALAHQIQLLESRLENLDDHVTLMESEHKLEQMTKRAWWAPKC